MAIRTANVPRPRISPAVFPVLVLRIAYRMIAEPETIAVSLGTGVTSGGTFEETVAPVTASPVHLGCARSIRDPLRNQSRTVDRESSRRCSGTGTVCIRQLVHAPRRWQAIRAAKDR